MGPASWNITFDTLLQRFQRMNVEAVAYADDCVIVTAGKTYNEAKNASQKALEAVGKWCRHEKQSLVPKKCKTLIVKGVLKAPTRNELKIGNEGVKIVSEFMYLGVTFSNRRYKAEQQKNMHSGITAEAHLQEVGTKTKKLFNSIGQLAKHLEKGAGRHISRPLRANRNLCSGGLVRPSKQNPKRQV